MNNHINDYTNGAARNKGDFYSISKYIPLLTFMDMRSLTTELSVVSAVFRKPIFESYNYGNTSSKILEFLSSSMFLRKVETNGLEIYIGKGAIYDSEGNILLCLSVETQIILDLIAKNIYNYNSFFEERNNFIGYDAFVMFVSTEFANDKKFAVLYRRIKKIYLDYCFEKGIEMRLVSSSKIKENTFTNSLKIKFNSLTELNRHLTEDVKYLLQTPLENFQETEYPLLLGTPPVLKNNEKKTPWGEVLHQELEDRLKVLKQPRDSMLEDSDVDERDFGPFILDMEAIPTRMPPSLEELHQMLHQTAPLFIDAPVPPPISPHEADRIDAIVAAGLFSLSQSRDSARELVGIPSIRFTNPPASYDASAGLNRTTLEEAINYLAIEREIEEETREAEREEDTSWMDVFENDQQEEEQERDLPY